MDGSAKPLSHRVPVSSTRPSLDVAGAGAGEGQAHQVARGVLRGAVGDRADFQYDFWPDQLLAERRSEKRILNAITVGYFLALVVIGFAAGKVYEGIDLRPAFHPNGIVFHYPLDK